jgi:hypothetical protein
MQMSFVQGQYREVKGYDEPAWTTYARLFAMAMSTALPSFCTRRETRSRDQSRGDARLRIDKRALTSSEEISLIHPRLKRSDQHQGKSALIALLTSDSKRELTSLVQPSCHTGRASRKRNALVDLNRAGWSAGRERS